MTEFHERYPSEHGAVRRARQDVVAFARSWYSGQDLADIEHAVGEALSNAAEHGHKPGASIDVRCRCEGDRFTIEVRDEGEGFPRWNAREPTPPNSDSPRGYGIFIMRSLMDDVKYSEGGKNIWLMKRLPRSSSVSDARDSA